MIRAGSYFMPLKQMYRKTVGALHFLSIIRWGDPGPFDPKGIVPYFPIVGLIIGAVVALCDLLIGRLFPPEIIGVIIVALVAVLSGALHLDGLADTADGLFSHRGRERALEIMKDSRIGVMGAVVLILTLGLKIAGIGALDHNRSLILLTVPALSRGGVIAAMQWLPYGRPQGGTGQAFTNGGISISSFGGIIPAIILLMLAGWLGLLVLGVFICISGAIIKYYSWQMGCITGDMLGAMIEITETCLFLTAAIHLTF